MRKFDNTDVLSIIGIAICFYLILQVVNIEVSQKYKICDELDCKEGQNKWTSK